MKLNIMTWNTGITESLNDEEKCNKILNYIECFLQKENTIVFLQQMVFKDPHNNWEKHRVFNIFCEKFSEEYSIEYYPNSKLMMTVAIARKNNNIKSLGDDFYPISSPMNRAIAVEFNGISFLGIHAGNGSDNKEYLNSLHGKADIILGDFNAGNYLESENRDTFNNILKEHICICNMPTKEIRDRQKSLKRKSCIDHIFVRECIVTLCSNLVVNENVKLSDHYPITFEIDLR